MIISKIKNIFGQHYLAIIFSILVGMIFFGPHIWFIVSNYEIYQGVPLIENSNQDYYIARTQEIIDGHYLAGSLALFEYKDQFPIHPPTSEFLFALPTLLFGVPVTLTILVSKFILPTLLFLLAYALIYCLLGKKNEGSHKIAALAGAIFITLGYDLIDYRTTLSLITGAVEPTSCLLWSRPMNPIMGAIYLFSFLLFVWFINQENKYYKFLIAGAGISLALMFTSYFFSWGLAISILAILGFLNLLKRNYFKVSHLIYVVIFGVFLSSPYWYLSWKSGQSIWYSESLLRSGMFYTHYSMINKLILAVLAIYIPYLAIRLVKKNKIENFDLFILAFLLGGLWAYNQQIITGITVWPYHFVQYTIPLSIVSIMIILHNILHKKYKKLFILIITIIIFSSFWLGIYTQYKNYTYSLDRNKSAQAYAPMFDWFNQQEKDCVVLVDSDDLDNFLELSGTLLSYTHCNVYFNTWVFSLMPQDRIYHNYLVNLRFQGIKADEVSEAIKKPELLIVAYLFSNWVGLHEVSMFPDFKDLELPKRIESVPNDYVDFLEKDLITELDKYRLDFIISDGPLAEDIKSQLSNTELIKQFGNIHIYKYIQNN